ncbi:MAG: Gfo/Idh/MocA family oxidoreductase [Litorimonas sp.]
MSKQLKIGLIGAGVFAGYHANKLTEHPRVVFTGVCDPDASRAEGLAKKHNIKPLPLKALLETSDAIVIACPASFHGSVALQALEAGCHCLIEKPLAVTAKEALDIADLSATKNLIVQVGHQERMVLRAIGLDDVKERPVKIEAVRNSPYSERGIDTSVTFDLMTHDIDLCTALMGAAPDRIEGQSGEVRSRTPDMAYARLWYGQSIACLSASRVESQSERWMKITYPSGEVRIDFNAKTVMNSTGFPLNTDFAENDIAKDSLGAATQVFVQAVLDDNSVLVSAQDGAIAVQVAETIDRGE